MLAAIQSLATQSHARATPLEHTRRHITLPPTPALILHGSVGIVKYQSLININIMCSLNGTGISTPVDEYFIIIASHFGGAVRCRGSSDSRYPWEVRNRGRYMRRTGQRARAGVLGSVLGFVVTGPLVHLPRDVTM